MRNFLLKIKDSLELKYEHLRGLNGLTAKEVKKITGMDFNRAPASVSRALKNPLSNVPQNGRVIEHLKANDHLICDVDSDDIWVKLKLLIEADYSTFLEAELEVKFDKNEKGDTFQKVIQKLILQIWNQHCSDQASNHKDKNYVLIDFRILQIDCGTALQLVEISSSDKKKQEGIADYKSRQSTIKQRKTKKYILYISEDQTIGDVFNYQNNLVKVSCMFMNLKDLFLQQVNSGQISSQVSPSIITSIDSSGLKLSSTVINNRLTGMQQQITKNPKSATIFAEQDNDQTPNFKNKNDQIEEPGLLSSNKKSDNNFASSMENNYHKNLSDPYQSEYGQALIHPSNDESYEIQENGEDTTKDSGLIQKTPRKNSFLKENNNNQRVSLTKNKQDPQRKGSTSGERSKFTTILQKYSDISQGQDSKNQHPYSIPIVQMVYTKIQGNIVFPRKNPVPLDEESQNLPESSSNVITETQTLDNESFVVTNKAKAPFFTNRMSKGDEVLIDFANQSSNQSFQPQLISSQNQTKNNSARLSSSANVNINPLLPIMQFDELPEIEEVQERDEVDQFSFHHKVRKLEKDPEGFKEHQARTDRRESTQIFRLPKNAPDNEEQPVRSTINESMVMETEDEMIQEETFANKELEQSMKDTMNMYEGSGSKSNLELNQPGFARLINDLENSSRHSSSHVVESSQPLESPKFGNNGKNMIIEEELKEPLISEGKIQNSKTQSDLKKQQRHSQLIQKQLFLEQANVMRKSGMVTNTKGPLLHNSTSRQIQEEPFRRKSTGVSQLTISSTQNDKKNSKNKLLTFFSKFKRTNAAHKNQSKLTINDPAFDQITTLDMLQRIILPTFLLNYEDYQLIQLPPVKNVIIAEKDKNSSSLFKSMTIDENQEGNNEDELPQGGIKKKHFIIVAILVLLVAAFLTGIYFIIDMSISNDEPAQ